MKKARRAKKFLKALEDGNGIVAYACENTGISRQTYYRWIKEDPVFAEECENIKEEVIDKVEHKLLKVINDPDAPGHLTALIFYLKTQAKNRGYVERYEQEVSGNAFEQLMKDLPEDGD